MDSQTLQPTTAVTIAALVAALRGLPAGSPLTVATPSGQYELEQVAIVTEREGYSVVLVAGQKLAQVA